MTERPALLLRIAPTAKTSASQSRAVRHAIRNEALLTIVTPPPAFSLAREERTATRQDVGCRKLLRQHMYVTRTISRARTPGTIPSSRCQTTRTHEALLRCFDGANKCSHGRTMSADWWSQSGSNRRPHACKARALPAELWPLNLTGSPASRERKRWWAWEDLNFRPHAYQARALTN